MKEEPERRSNIDWNGVAVIIWVFVLLFLAFGKDTFKWIGLG